MIQTMKIRVYIEHNKLKRARNLFEIVLRVISSCFHHPHRLEYNVSWKYLFTAKFSTFCNSQNFVLQVTFTRLYLKN